MVNIQPGMHFEQEKSADALWKRLKRKAI